MEVVTNDVEVVWVETLADIQDGKLVALQLKIDGLVERDITDTTYTW